MNISTFRLAVLLPLLTTVFCACQTRPLPTVSHVDPQRYAGQWHELARVKNPFEKKDERAVAQYEVLSPTQLRVTNTATNSKGKTRSITGLAEMVPDSDGARWRVRFNGLAGLFRPSREGNYYIIGLRPDYQAALVGTPDRKTLWILARSTTLDAGTINSFMTRADMLGFPMDQFVWDAELPVRKR